MRTFPPSTRWSIHITLYSTSSPNGYHAPEASFPFKLSKISQKFTPLNGGFNNSAQRGVPFIRFLSSTKLSVIL